MLRFTALFQEGVKQHAEIEQNKKELFVEWVYLKRGWQRHKLGFVLLIPLILTLYIHVLRYNFILVSSAEASKNTEIQLCFILAPLHSTAECIPPKNRQCVPEEVLI